jgi:hypothetical protein
MNVCYHTKFYSIKEGYPASCINCEELDPKMPIEDLAKLLPTKVNDWNQENKIYPVEERHNLRIFIGIIDIMQDFNKYKRSESMGKTVGSELAKLLFISVKTYTF